jgi:hypothetical protein
MGAEYWALKVGRERRLSQIQRHLLLVLAVRHNRDYQCAFPKIDHLSEETGISERHIQRMLNDMSTGERPVLHISYGPLPETRNGRPVYANRYRLVGLDPIPTDAPPRRQLGGRPALLVDDTLSSDLDDTLSSDLDDTGDTSEMTPATKGDDTLSSGQMTSPNSPLRTPVKNPLKEPQWNPDARASARAREDDPPPKTKMETTTETPRAPTPPTDSMTCVDCHQVIDTRDYRTQHTPGCDYAGLYPFAMRHKRGRLIAQQKEDAARAARGIPPPPNGTAEPPPPAPRPSPAPPGAPRLYEYVNRAGGCIHSGEACPECRARAGLPDTHAVHA